MKSLSCGVTKANVQRSTRLRKPRRGGRPTFKVQFARLNERDLVAK